MSRAVVASLVLLMLGVFAPGAQAQVDVVYRSMHDHVCDTAEWDIENCPSLQGAERWAAVVMWCRANPTAEGCQAALALKDQPVVIAFNHDTRSWRGVYGVEPGDIDLSKDGAPNVLSSNGRNVVAVIESTNPLLYVAVAGAITETDAEVVADLAKLLGPLGDAITGIMAHSEALLSETTTARVQAAQDAIEPVRCAVEHWTRAQVFIQRVEKRRGAEYEQLAQKCNKIGSDTLVTQFTVIENALQALRDPALCVAQAKLLHAFLDTSPRNVTALETARNALALGAACETKFADLLANIDTRIRGLKAAQTEAQIMAAQQAWREEGQADRADLQRLIDVESVISRGDALLVAAKRTEIRNLIGDIERFETRLVRTLATLDPKTQSKAVVTADVPDWFVVPNGTIAVAWEQNRARTLNVKKTSEFADGIVAQRPADVATSYGAASLSASLVEVNVSLTHTQLSSPVFDMVSEPDPANPGMRRNVIARTDEEERSGKLAVFAAYPVLHHFTTESWARRVGLELGVGTDTNNPALFLGASWKLNRAIRLGLGSTWQQVKALDGQNIGDPISAATDIKRQNELENSWYASFSFNLGSLGLFNND